MSYLDAWIICTPSAIATVSAENGGNGTRQYHNSEVITGHWKSAGAREVFNVCVTKSQLDAYVAALNTAESGSVSAVYAWTQGRADSQKADYPHLPAEIIALMKDHVTYDDLGNETSRVPATQENPNWGHIFSGQGVRLFAGAFNEKFNYNFA